MIVFLPESNRSIREYDTSLVFDYLFPFSNFTTTQSLVHIFKIIIILFLLSLKNNQSLI